MANYDTASLSDCVAIIGMSGRFPGAGSVGELWENLKRGQESVRFLSKDQLLECGLEASMLEQPNFVGVAGVLDDVEMFDASFFGYSASEAEIIDPEHRLFLECAWQALEHAGVDPEAQKTRTGVYAGAGLLPSYIYQVTANRDLLKSRFYSVVTGNDKDHLAPRVAYKLDLRGPAITIQTACSTSLVAVHLACQSVLSGECDVALAGGASIRLRPGYLYEEGGILSPDGHCRAFDAEAAGTVPGSGIGIVVLKRFADAVRDGDTVYAVIRGSAVNNDGCAKVGYTAPSIDGQAAVIAEALAIAGVTADTVSYVEAHGTGTTLGDPIEVSALSKAYRAHTAKKGFCALGSIKTNIGHLDSAAGVTGLIKTALSLYHKVVPPTLHFHSPNPQLELTGSPFYINSQLREWESASGPRRAGVSSFGMGGTNAHMILEEAPPRESSSPSRPNQLLAVSAKTAPALDEAIANLERHLGEARDVNFPDVAYTFQTGRKAFHHRGMLVCKDTADALTLLKNRTGSRSVTTGLVSGHPNLAFAFPGQGVPYVGMGRSLYESEPIFREWIDICATGFKSHSEFDVRDYLCDAGPDLAQSENETKITQPALFSLEYSLAQLWMAWGIRPAALIGHSLGELVAACVAGVFSLEDAFRLVSIRGRLMDNIPAGAMLAVSLSESELRHYLSQSLSIAAINGPSRCVVSGLEHAIAELESKLSGKGFGHRRLQTSRPFHSSLVEPILGPYRECLRTIRLAPPRLPYVSNLTGVWIDDSQAIDPEYWARHLREPVNFNACIDEMLTDPNRVLLEVGPGATLVSSAARHPARKQNQVLVSSMGSDSDQADLLKALGKLWLAGVDVNWQAFHAGEQRHRVALPTYPFQRERHWIGTPPPGRPKGENISMQTVTPTCNVASDRQPRIVTCLKEIFGGFLGVKAADIPSDITFIEMGADSLMLLQVSQEVKRSTGVKIPFRKMLDDVSTIDKLAAYVNQKAPPEQFAAAASHTEVETSLAVAPLISSPVALKPEPIAPITGHLEGILGQQLQAMSRLISEQLEVLKHAGLKPADTPSQQPASNGSRPAIVESQRPPRTESAVPTATAALEGLDSRQRKHLHDLIARFSRRTAKSKLIAERYRPTVADDRATSGFHPLWKEMQYSLIAQRASGARVWDVDDNEYVDITMGFGALLFGHSPQFVTDALKTQTRKGVQLGWESFMSRKAAELICELTGVERVAFCNSGTEAVMSALRLARAFTGREKIAVFEGAYHGTFDQVLVRKNPDGSCRAMPLAPGIPRHITDNVILLDPNRPESLDILRERGAELAAVLVEPMQRARLDRGSETFLKALRKITEDTGSALILDEVITGFRFHPGGAQALFDVRADLVTYGKSIGGGVPVAVVAGKAAFMDAIDGGMWKFGDHSLPEADATFFTGTFFKHPLIMAPVAAVLEHIKASGPKLQEDLNETTAGLVERLNESFRSAGLPLNATHKGSFFRFQFAPELKWTELFYFHLLVKGLYVCETRNCFLSTAHTADDIDYIVRAATEAAEEMREGGFFPGGAERAPRTVPLTEGQKQVWALAQMGDGASGACNESFSIDLRGPLQVPTLRKTIQKIVDRHSALRSTISANGEDRQVHPQIGFVIEHEDLQDLDEASKTRRLKAWLADQAGRPLDLERGPLFRIGLAPLGNRHHVLALTFSHIVVDARSNGILIGELAALYNAECQGTPAPAAEMAALDSPNTLAISEDQFRIDEEYWIAQFTGADPVLDFPTDRPRPTQPTYGISRESVEIDARLVKELRKLGAANGSTLFMTLLSTFSALVRALSRSDDVSIGVNLASETGEESENAVGYSINPLAIRLKMADGTPFRDHLAHTKRQVLDAYEHREYPVGRLIKKLNLWRQCASRLPFSSVVFNLDKTFTGMAFFALETVITSNPAGAKVDMEWNVIESNDKLIVDCDYNSDLFDPGTIKRWLRNYVTLLQRALSNPGQILSVLVEPAKLAPQKAAIYSKSNLTLMQSQFWIGQKMQPDTPVYNRPCRFIIHGPVDRRHFQRALQALIEASDALRTIIRDVDGVPQRSVLSAMDCELEFVDFSQTQDPKHALNEWVAGRATVNFDSEKRMFDSGLVKLADHKYVFYLNCHNIIADGMSAFLVYAAVAEAYSRSLNGEADLLQRPPFEEYHGFERQHRASARYPKSELYWKRQLSKTASPLNFYGRTAPAQRSGAIRVTHAIDRRVTNRLRALANQTGIFVATEDLSLFSIFATILMTYLHQVSGNRDLSLSVTYHNRVSKSFSTMIGVLMQVLPLRLALGVNETLRSLSRRISGQILEGLKHLPYTITDSGEYRKGQVLLNYINSTWPEFDGALVDFHWDHSGYQDELLVVQPHRIDSEGNLAIEFDFDRDLFDQRLREQAIGDFLQVMDAFIADSDQPLDSPEILWSDSQKVSKASLEDQVVFDI